ncbi:MAG: nucleotidyltransferase family protein [Eubacteriales bacterium]|nr:nucleotidyltransferase family protein [Eubacteriales bacterium]
MIGIIYLASGFARRFGSNKLFYPIEGKEMYRFGLDILMDLCREKISGQEIKLHVVTQYAEIMEECRRRKVAYTQNTMAEEGIAASVRLGVLAFPDADWFLFLPADQPGITKETMISFIKAVLSQPKTMASVYCENKPGNPTMFHSSYRQALLSLKGDKGGRKIMKASPENVFWYPISFEEIVDIDQPAEIIK